MPNYLTISLIAPVNSDVLTTLMHSIYENQCNIEETHASIMSGTLAVIQLVSGRWDNLAKLETVLCSMESRYDVKIATHNSEQINAQEQTFTFSIEITGIDRPGIISRMVDFFTAHSISIQRMSSTRFKVPHNSTPMCSLQMLVDIPEQIPIAQVRDEFLDLCDSDNFDCMIEPVKL